MGITNYDYAIIGAGAAGLNLALVMAKESFFNDKSIVIIDSDKKETNDKTWCFWSQGPTPVDSVISKKWRNAIFTTREGQKETLPLDPFTYNMVHSSDFNTYAKRELNEHINIHWLEAHVTRLNEDDSGVEVITTSQTLTIAEHIFDSRISEKFELDNSSTKLLQHFKGWVIETNENCFDDSSFVMMDFSLTWKNTTSFTYVLPYSSNKALVEFTFFSPELVEEQDYDQMIEKYLVEHLNIKDYIITDTEMGIIPMSDYSFHAHNTPRTTKIGTAGSWVKPSSGYSFRNALKLSKQLTKNIVNGNKPTKGLLSSKHRFYDAIFLDVLYTNNHLGPDLFRRMYQKNKAPQILKFLNEETSLMEEIKILSSFPIGIFNKALFKRLF